MFQKKTDVAFSQSVGVPVLTSVWRRHWRWSNCFSKPS